MMDLFDTTHFASYTPPKGQLLKWVGNKQKFAGEITKCFPKEFNTFYEPFIGSGAIMATVSPQRGIGSDIFPPLIEIWNTLKNNPDELIEWYAQRRNRVDIEGKKDVYESVKHSFNNQHNGADFLFLTRSCYGGIVRFRKSDGYMSTPCGVHNPISVTSFSRRVKEWHKRMRNIDFYCTDYKTIFDQATAGDLIYCDPPYSHSQSILYGSQAFRLEELFECIRNAKNKGVSVALSIDGSKKSGKYLCDLAIPENIFEQEIFIKLGRSMLRRFQMQGKTLEKDLVSDRLLLTYTI